MIKNLEVLFSLMGEIGKMFNGLINQTKVYRVKKIANSSS